MRKALFYLLPLMMLLWALPGSAQDRKKEPPLKTVTGKVVDKDDKGLASAIIYLRNLSNKNEVTHISDDDGSFRFSGLDPNVDYEIHAEFQGKSSPKRTVSSFDNRKEIIIILKVDRK